MNDPPISLLVIILTPSGKLEFPTPPVLIFESKGVREVMDPGEASQSLGFGLYERVDMLESIDSPA